MIQDGRPVFDHRSRNPDGQRTDRHHPALRPAASSRNLLRLDSSFLLRASSPRARSRRQWRRTPRTVTLMRPATSNGRVPQQVSRGFSLRRVRAVVRFCSGTLLNNRQQDFTPYFLTAAHCVGTEEEARSVTAFWLYQTQTCNGELPDFQSVPHTEGASLLSTTGFRELGRSRGRYDAAAARR